jgi:PucR C-terminal helix-turn-helix domain
VEVLPAGVSSLVDAALHGDDPERLVEVAARELEAPLALVSPSGYPLGWAPRDDAGRRALAVAEAAARAGLVAPPGWQIVPVSGGAFGLGFVAVGDGGQPAMLDLVVALLAEQLHRGELLRARSAAFLRRLITEPEAGRPRARREAAELGLALADAYWPAVLAWRNVAPRQNVVEAIERESAAVGALTVRRAGSMVLLHPGDAARAWFERVVACARRLAPAAGAQAVAADAPVELRSLSAQVMELEALSRLGPRAEEQPVLSARQYALDRLLMGRVGSRAFVLDQLGALIEWDREHRGDLLTVLEAALDYPLHEEAAHRCYMHRNTFRHRLRVATDVLGHDLEDPDVRLATHVALKLRKVAGGASSRSAPAAAPARTARTRGRRGSARARARGSPPSR